MSNFKMITYRPEIEYKGPHFFILNKGLNSGKPLKKPCPNCFVISCETEKEKESLYWIVYSLHQGKQFQIALVGSVIPFIRKNDLINIIKDAQKITSNNPEAIQKTVSSLLELEKKEENYKRIQNTLKQLRQVLVHQLIKQ
ncbi:DUF6943 family protein [Brumimicrobium aurantiacum]|uniref:Uncharacterized protein n=1 Tax=Brumimicrobium aurantiacum TaxID=1737063 RepID=A0A3E1EWW3_9FLAO|nr:hypothetical protein [Brumimicrobium aurantiacum]RFC54046.1 hypothetical protein DXU93_10935 [Brumimicrobium aurantiacum]